MLSLNYLEIPYAEIKDINSFYRELLPEIPKIRSFVNTLRLVFSLPLSCIQLFVGQGERFYRIVMRDSKKNIFGWFYILPLENRVDLYDSSSSDIPIIQWKNRKAVTKNYNQTFINIGIEKSFSRLINTI